MVISLLYPAGLVPFEAWVGKIQLVHYLVIVITRRWRRVARKHVVWGYRNCIVGA